VVFLRNAGSCPQTEFLNWFGTVEVKIQRPQVTAHLRMREVSRISQGCHTCNRTTQHPVVKHPAVRFRQVLLMVFRVGHVNSGHGPLRGVVRTFTGEPRGKRKSEAPHINDSSSPLNVFLLYFAEIVMLVVETNRYYHDHLDRLDEGPSPLPDVTEDEMLMFLAITIQTGRCIWNKLTDYWTRAYITTQCSMVTL